jgi:hypothetical protein
MDQTRIINATGVPSETMKCKSIQHVTESPEDNDHPSLLLLIQEPKGRDVYSSSSSSASSSSDSSSSSSSDSSVWVSKVEVAIRSKSR